MITQTQRLTALGALVLGVGFSVVAASANAPLTDDARQAVHEAVLAGDYDQFVAALPEQAQDNVPTAEEFAQMNEVAQLAQSGDTDGARELAQQYGLKRGMGMGGKPDGHRGPSPEVEAAIAAGDYPALVAAVGEDSPILEHITADNIAQHAQVHALMESGDREAARELADQLGISMPMPGGHGPRGLSPEVMDALAAGDYAALVAAAGEDSEILDSVTAENISQYAEVHALMQAGDREAADALAQQYNLQMPQYKDRHGPNPMMDQDSPAHQAMIDGDYDAFIAALPEQAQQRAPSSEQFERMSEVAQLASSGDTEGARELAQQYGLDNGKHRGHDRGRRDHDESHQAADDDITDDKDSSDT